MNAEKSSRLRMQKLLASILLLFAVMLLAFKIYADNEPGALPLLLLLIGTIWYFITYYRLRTLKNVAE
jgi:predicted MFS family arabinose efflux permease